MATLYATTFFQGDGTNRRFSFPFRYLDRAHVFATINNVPVTFAWLSDTDIFADVAPTETEVIRVYRVTPVANENVTFSNATTLLSDDLNGASLQLLYACQEFADALSVQKTEEQQDVTKLAASILANTAAITAEANSRDARDATLQAGINAEAFSRATRDTTLQANIDAEVQARTAAIAALQASIALLGKVSSGSGLSASDVQAYVKSAVASTFANLTTTPPAAGSGLPYLNGGIVMVAK